MQAKIKFHCHITLLPDCDEHLSEAHDVLLEAIEEFQTENDIADQGNLFLFYFFMYSLFCQDFHPVHDMDCLVSFMFFIFIFISTKPI